MNTHFAGDTAVLLGRSMRHITRSPDTIITTAIMPIAFMLLFVYVFGGAIKHALRSALMSNFSKSGKSKPAAHRYSRAWTSLPVKSATSTAPSPASANVWHVCSCRRRSLSHSAV